MADTNPGGEPGDIAPRQTLEEAKITIGSHVLLMERREGGGVLRLVAPNGTFPFEILITEAGAVLRLGTGLAVSVDGPVTLDMDTLSVHARGGIAIRSDEGIGLRAGGDIVSEGEAQNITARLGNIDVKANDDVVLLGERIKLNC